MVKSKKTIKLDWQEAPDIKNRIIHILQIIKLPHIDEKKITCYRTYGSHSRSFARIWSFPKIFQQALHIEPHYVIEVLSKYYDPLDEGEKTRVLIHELLHIPKNFSGALLPHRTRSRHLDTEANKLYSEYLRNLPK